MEYICLSIHVWIAYIDVIFVFGLLKKIGDTLPKFTLLPIKTSLTMTYVSCRIDRQKNRKIFDWHHQSYIEQWELLEANMDENDEPHTNRE